MALSRQKRVKVACPPLAEMRRSRNLFFDIGEMAEWLNAAVSKTVVPGFRDRGFESLSLRMFYTYVLLSGKSGIHYYGSTKNLEDRLDAHNSGKVKFTKAHMPWKLVYSECFPTRSDAAKRELFFKSIDGYK